MCTRGQCAKHQGQWVQFQTQWGTHRGIVESVNQHAVLMRVPRQYAPVGLTSFNGQSGATDEQKLDLALTQWGYGGGGYGGGYGYGARGGYGRRPGGYGGWWAGGWWWWWLAFAWIFALGFFW